MAAARTFHCSVITPERAVLEREATFVAFPATDGEMGILAGRAPLLTQLGAGELRVDSAAGKERLFVAGGFAQMVDNKLSLLTEEARPIAELERAAAASELQAALALPVVAGQAGQPGQPLKNDAPGPRDRALARARAKARLATG